MEGSVLTKVVLPLSLFIIMLGMGLSLIPEDFRRVGKYPKAVAIGLVAQMLVLPVLGFVVAKVFGMTGELAVGLVILSLCPGGVTSNMISYLSRGDVALSISLTAVVSMVTPFTIPIFAGMAMGHFMEASQNVSLPIKSTIIALLVITVVPVGIGMLIRAKKPAAAMKAEKPVRIFSLLILAILIAAITMKQKNLGDMFVRTGLPGLALNVSAMAFGFAVAKLAGLGHRQRVTIGVEVGIQNGTTALLVTQTLIVDAAGKPYLDMAVAPAIYSLIMFGTGAIFGILVNLGRDREAADAESEAAAVEKAD